MTMQPDSVELKQRGAKSPFRRNIVRIASGTALAQVAALAAMPVLARFYKPEDFGALAVFVAIHSLVAAFFTLKYEQSIILPVEDRAAVELTVVTMLCSGGFSFCLLLILIAWNLVSTVHVPAHYFLLPVSAVLSAAYTCGQQWGGRASDYRRFSRSQWVNAMVNAASAMIIAVVLGPSSGRLVLAYVVGLAAAVIYQSYRAVLTPGSRGFGTTIDAGALLRAAGEYKRFPFLVLPSSAIATIGQTGQPFLMQALFPLRDVGLFAIANRVLTAPTALVGGAVGEAFRAELVKRMKAGLEISHFFSKTLRRLLGLGAVVYAGAFLAAPSIFVLVFGAEYHEAGVLARYVCGAALAQFIAQPFAYVFVATGRMRLGLQVQAAFTVAPMIGIIVGGMRGRMAEATLYFSVLGLLAAGVLVAFAYRCCVQHDRVKVE